MPSRSSSFTLYSEVTFVKLYCRYSGVRLVHYTHAGKEVLSSVGVDIEPFIETLLYVSGEKLYLIS